MTQCLSLQNNIGRFAMIEIKSVEKGSIAERHGIKAGDILISVNGNDVNDVLDYRFYLTDRSVVLKIHRGAELFDICIRKGEYDDIGLDSDTYLMDEKHSCRNKCVFCFIDQLPKGMRDTLYFKDDDSRLSFLMGNYITMTNMSIADIDRIVKMKMSPVNISVHTTNPGLRCMMMKNRFAGDILEKMERLRAGGIMMNCQLVVCKGLNDGEELIRSMRDLERMYPNVQSVSIVPSGLTKYRDGLYDLEMFSPSECSEIISAVEKFADECYEKHGSRIFFAADELYIKAGRELHEGEYYEGYMQIENGVGMITSMKEEFDDEFSFIKEDYDISLERDVSIATGCSAYAFIKSLADKISYTCPKTKISVYKIRNDFFGDNITVAGLLCGCDVIAQLKGKHLGDKLILPAVALRSERDMMLDGTTPDELSAALGVNVEFSESSGADFIKAVMG